MERFSSSSPCGFQRFFRGDAGTVQQRYVKIGRSAAAHTVKILAGVPIFQRIALSAVILIGDHRHTVDLIGAKQLWGIDTMYGDILYCILTQNAVTVTHQDGYLTFFATQKGVQLGTDFLINGLVSGTDRHIVDGSDVCGNVIVELAAAPIVRKQRDMVMVKHTAAFVRK